MAKKKRKLFGKFGENDENIIDVVEEKTEDISDVVENVSENIEQTAEEVNETIEQVSDEATEITETASENIEAVEEAAGDLGKNGESLGQEMSEWAENINENAEEKKEESQEAETEVSSDVVSTTIADPGDNVTEVSTFDTTNIGKQDKMATKKTKTKKVKVKKDRLGFNWFFWLSFIIILVPVCYFLYLIYSAYQETHIPIVGDRINSEIETVIQTEQVENINSRIKTIEGVEGCNSDLIVETLRIKINVNDDLTEEDMRNILSQAYDIVNEVLPVDSYFTQHNDYKEYDLEIYSYDDLESDDLRIVLLNKNSKMEEFNVQTITTAVNQEIADELQQLREEQRYERDHPEEETEEEETPTEESAEPNENNMAADDVEG
ncbi:MAG: hypothetical protein IJ115_01360 [Erysipelotrichaceae bacterium]|nr:hypothetical protein [Erysipelotrichaceae bacterium]